MVSQCGRTSCGEGHREQPTLQPPPSGIINQDQYVRHAFLQERVATTRTVWSLYGPSGWATRTDSRGRTILPLFPDAAATALCAVNDWQGYEPRAVEGAALFPWLAELHRANRKLAMFPSPGDAGIITNPARFAEDLKRTMAVLPFVSEDDED